MRIIILFFSFVFLTSCGAYLHQPIKPKEARIASKTSLEKELIDLPKPRDPIVVAVYKFKDQTGQYKPAEIGSSFSTAVTQGGTNILIKALDDTGWFTVIERENIGNLLNERKIIRQTRMQYQEGDGNAPLVNPLLFAGVILEGGIVSYDSNIKTGGIGVRYFGTGGSSAYRQDRVTVYLRAIATKTGQVLKNVTTSKTILSQTIDGGMFRYVKFSRLLEAETGFTFNEPSDIAVTEAVQKAVYSLVVEGIKDGLWNIDTAFSEAGLRMMESYDSEITEGDLEDYLGVKTMAYDPTFSFTSGLNGSFYQGDYPSPVLKPGLDIGIDYDINRSLVLNGQFGTGTLTTQRHIDEAVRTFDLNLKYKYLKNKVRKPYFKVGLGNVFSRNFTQSNYKIQAGLGFDYNLSKSISLYTYADWNQFFKDDIDALESGKYRDYYYRGGIGLKVHLQKKK
jgi:curli production assembly/transport component CsgG